MRRLLSEKVFWFVCILLLNACSKPQVRTRPDNLSSLLAQMTLEEKVGQMMVPAYVPSFFHREDARFARLLNLVKKYHIGGIMIYRGPVYEVARSIERLQEAATIPLLISADLEWGASPRLDGSTRFPQNMAIGATRNPQYAYEIGEVTAREARAVGVHVAYAPVMDVNNNPENIIINTRSYGEEPELVAEMGAAFIRGLQANGLFATAKHFPGHGDTQTDSHMSLPSIDASKERMQAVELKPFQAAVSAGVKCIMTAHITFAQFPEMEGRPATLDPNFLQETLRGEMGFEGLIFTDAMDMGGITQNYWSGEAAVLAINAGADMVLIPPDLEVTYDFVLEAAKTGRIPISRIDESVARILKAKSELGLNEKPVTDFTGIESVVGDPAFAAKADEIAQAAVTLVRDEQTLLPLHAEALDSVLVLTISDEANGPTIGNGLNREVGSRVPQVVQAYLDSRSTEADIKDVLAKRDAANAVIVGVFVRWRDRKGTLALPDSMVNFLSKFFKSQTPTVVISFGSPHVLRQLPDVQTYLCAYDLAPVSVQSTVRAVFGEIRIKGRLPVSIPNLHQFGDGLQRPARKMELVKENSVDVLKDAYDVLEKAIADSIFPGAQLAVAVNGKLISSRGFGRQTYDLSSPKVTDETIYDLASVTKVAATTVAAMKLWENGKLLLDVPVKSYIPEFANHGKNSVTVRHLLTHTSGLRPFTDLWNKAKDREDALHYIYNMEPVYTLGDTMMYSDLGLITLGQILEKVSGMPLDTLVGKTIYAPLGLKSTMFNPPKELLSRIAPTEVGGHLQRPLIHGEVHDENAHFLGGVAPHAGLFSTAEDLAALAQLLLNGGIYRHHRVFSPATVKYWTQRQHIPDWSTRALGWDTPSDEKSSAGDYFSPGSFGHLGFTGTSFWVDPNRRIAIILLTNRVHPTRARGGMYDVRRDFHNAAMRALLQELGEEVPSEEMQTSN